MPTPPLVTGQQVQLTIENITHQGEGVAKHDGYTVFVPYAAPGDVVSAEVISTKKDYARALIKEIIHPGQRIEPKCQWYDQCGGCNLQHLDYQHQLDIKTETVKTTLRRIGGIDPEIVMPTQATRPWNYRNKLQAPVANYKGQLTAGLYKPRSHSLVPVTDCAIQHEPNNRIAERIAIIARETGIVPWDERQNKGTLRHIVVRHSESTGQSLVALVVSALQFPGRDLFLRKLKEQMKDLYSLVLNENPRPTNVILGEREEKIWGPGYITDTIGDLTFKISARSFWQVNPDGAMKIYEKAREYAHLMGQETVIDIYCGTGSIGLFLARDAKNVIGIESNTGAINDAKDNATMNKIDNAQFHAGDAGVVLPKMVKEGQQADVIILDPPRKGCDQALLDAVVEADPQRIVYISCNPGTLARDLKILGGKGYEANEIQPVDMFPHTSHVECCCCLVRS
jgi:23S rRNA (uracil1939-C5)-methyltransferase